MAETLRTSGSDSGAMKSPTASPPHRGTDGSNGSDGFDENGADQPSGVVGEARARAEEVVDDLTERVSDVADEGRGRAAEGLDGAAAMLRGQEDRLPGQVAERTADGMERTAGYLRSHDTAEIRSDVEDYVREHPIQGVAAAIAAGFLIGRMLR